MLSSNFFVIVGHLYIIFGEKYIQIIFLVVIIFFFYCCKKKKKPSNLHFYHFIHFYMLSISHNFISQIGVGSGNPLQYFCLENPMDRGAWQAVVHRVAQGLTCL